MTNGDQPNFNLINNDKRWIYLQGFGDLRKGVGPEAARLIAEDGEIVASIVGPDQRKHDGALWRPKEPEFREAVRGYARMLNKQTRAKDPAHRIVTVIFDPLERYKETESLDGEPAAANTGDARGE